MDLVVPHIQFCSYKHFYPESYSTGSAFNSVRVCNMACKSQIFVLPDHIRVIDFRKPNGTWSTKHLGNCVFAVSKYENSGSKGILQRFERLPKGALNGVESSSANGVNTSLNFEESEIHHLHVLIKNGELDEASRFLEYMTNKGNIYAFEFCKIGRTKNATRIMGILEESGAVIDITIYNVEEALRVLDCMSVSPNGINYDTILRSLCDRCKLKQGMEVLDRQLQIKCYPDVVTYTELIDAACKDSRVGQAMKLLIEMVSKECKPNVVTYNALIKGICNEGNLPSYGYQPDVISYTIVLHSLSSGGRWTDAMKLLASMLCKGCSLNVVTFNTLINFLCQKGLLGKAFNVLEMIQSMSVLLIP
ncbi:Pentatricopeptide repeat-containing protein [Glycine max]|nr:Pentatricopeptide repeat-containing protein [Glycine max]